MYVIGADLAGPAGAGSTGVAVFSAGEEGLRLVERECDGSDATVLGMVRELAREGPVVVGLDAPLSYEPGGKQRARDAELRKEIVKRGMRPGSVMAPTAPRMVYLTLRGIALAKVLGEVGGAGLVRVVEVHPGAAMRLRGAPLEAVMGFATDARAREELLGWLAGQGVRGVAAGRDCSSHFVAACAAGLAAWDWQRGRAKWVARTERPWHPYEFAA